MYLELVHGGVLGLWWGWTPRSVLWREGEAPQAGLRSCVTRETWTAWRSPGGHLVSQPYTGLNGVAVFSFVRCFYPFVFANDILSSFPQAPCILHLFCSVFFLIARQQCLSTRVIHWILRRNSGWGWEIPLSTPLTIFNYWSEWGPMLGFLSPYKVQRSRSHPPTPRTRTHLLLFAFLPSQKEKMRRHVRDEAKTRHRCSKPLSLDAAVATTQ